jgi:hypothetical protein
VGEERAQEAHRRELDRKPEQVVIAAAVCNSVAVNVVEVKEALELTRRWRLAVAAVAGDLRRAENVDRHPPSAALKPELSAGGDRDHAPPSAQPRHQRSAGRSCSERRLVWRLLAAASIATHTQREKTRLEQVWEIARKDGYRDFVDAERELAVWIDDRAWTRFRPQVRVGQR